MVRFGQSLISSSVTQIFMKLIIKCIRRIRVTTRIRYYSKNGTKQLQWSSCHHDFYIATGENQQFLWPCLYDFVVPGKNMELIVVRNLSSKYILRAISDNNTILTSNILSATNFDTSRKFTLARLASDLEFTLANRKIHSPWRAWRVLFRTL